MPVDSLQKQVGHRIGGRSTKRHVGANGGYHRRRRM
jgi:hypothetical protein